MDPGSGGGLRKRKIDRAASGMGRILGTNAYPNFHELHLQELIKGPEKDLSETGGSILRPIKTFRLSSPFEKLRLETEKSNKTPRVLLLKYGNPAWMTARATFAGNFFACAGYEIVDHSPFKSVEEGIDFAKSEEFEIVVLCSSDEVYRETAPLAHKALSGLAMLVIAGYPAEAIDELKIAGIEHFIHRKSNVLQTLTGYNRALL